MCREQGRPKEFVSSLGENAKSFRGNTLVTDSGMELPFDILVIAEGTSQRGTDSEYRR